MSQAQYDIYRRKVLDLTRTLVIKSSASADAINRELVALGHEVHDGDPESWKYYLHLAGEYHQTDNLMTIKSLDTLEEIPFTKNSLANHLATTREYREFGTYYRTLVERYPDQEDLIRGILNPVDMMTAIEAVDGQILYYDSDLVESNEENLIPKLENWCIVFSRRWFVSAYALVDDLYVPAHLAAMYMLIPSVVMNIRLGNCHTNYAHSYHIREYLASHQKLDWAVDYMTKKQMLWLYRQIRFIERNAGKRSTFESLVKNILTERNLPLAEWNMRHYLQAMPNELTPRVEFTRETLNLDLSSAGVEKRNVIEMLQAQEFAASGNSRVMDDVAPVIREIMEYSPNDELKTKVLETAIIDNADAAIFTLTDTLLNHWLYLSHIGRYTAVLSIDSPKTGQPIILSVKDAFVVFLYSFGKYLGLEMTNLPILPANFVRKLATPSRNVLEGLVDKRLVKASVFDAIFDNLTPIGTYISTEAFYRDIEKVHEGLLRHRWIWTTRENRDERGMVEGAAMHLYHHYNCDLGSSQTFEQWFIERGLDIPSFTRIEAGILADALVSHATGANLTATTSVREILAAMIKIMQTLSSYSIQFLKSVNTQPLIVTDWPMPRVGNIKGQGGDHIEGVAFNLDVQDVKEKGAIRDRLEGVAFDTDPRLSVIGYLSDRIEFDINCRASNSMRFKYRVEIPNIDIVKEHYPESLLSAIVDQDTDSYQPTQGVPLSEAFEALLSPHYELDLSDLTTLQQRWNNRPADPIPNYLLNGLKYPQLFPPDTYIPIFDPPPLPIDFIDVTIDSLNYPSLTNDMVFDGLDYDTVQVTSTVDQQTYVTLQMTMTASKLDYPNVSVVITSDGTPYVNQALTMISNGIDYNN